MPLCLPHGNEHTNLTQANLYSVADYPHGATPRQLRAVSFPHKADTFTSQNLQNKMHRIRCQISH